MNQQALESSASASFGSAIVVGVGNKLGWFDSLNANAPGISIMVAVFFGSVGSFFTWKACKKQQKSDKNEKIFSK